MYFKYSPQDFVCFKSTTWGFL